MEQGLGFWVQSLGFRVEGLRFTHFQLGSDAPCQYFLGPPLVLGETVLHACQDFEYQQP